MRLLLIFIFLFNLGSAVAREDLELNISYVGSDLLVTLFNRGRENTYYLKDINFCMSAPKGINVFLKNEAGTVFRHSSFLNRMCYAPKDGLASNYGVMHLIDKKDITQNKFSIVGGKGGEPLEPGVYELGVKICSSMKDYKLADCIYSNSLPYTVSTKLK
ncbi:hypothetical protein [Pseudoalteromonas rubra]|uniref:Uncharacterized protein n=1 Tax=Pseudoalteromonas rubra TaxID=43658 RepID=A0A0U2X814_9GAMM|nr:hypothetical protein [Pseudoalteromonas rubra]ALU44084.1 hypothetical protein AT705_14700 [Pseudoalteromonas rubra]